MSVPGHPRSYHASYEEHSSPFLSTQPGVSKHVDADADALNSSDFVRKFLTATAAGEKMGGGTTGGKGLIISGVNAALSDPDRCSIRRDLVLDTNGGKAGGAIPFDDPSLG